MVGTLLNVKPLITFEDGIVAPLGRGRGTKKALRLLVDTAMQWRQNVGTTYGVLSYAGVSFEGATILDELKDLLATSGFTFELRLTNRVGSVIGTYAGPGAVCLFFVEEPA